MPPKLEQNSGIQQGNGRSTFVGQESTYETGEVMDGNDLGQVMNPLDFQQDSMPSQEFVDTKKKKVCTNVILYL